MHADVTIIVFSLLSTIKVRIAVRLAVITSIRYDRPQEVTDNFETKEAVQICIEFEVK